MKLKRLMRLRRSPAKEKSPAPQHEQTAEADAQALQHEMDTPFQANIMQLQSIVGNRGVQRLLAESQVQPRTGMLQLKPDPAPAPTVEAPEQPATSEQQQPTTTPSGVGDEAPMIGEETVVVFSGGPEFHAKALRMNQYYANHPPKEGWPFTSELRGLWDSGNYDGFADRVGSLQTSMNMPDEQIDGALGPVTSRGLVKPAAPATPQGQTGTAPATSSTTAPTTTAPQTTTATPTAQTPAPPTAAAAPQVDDPAVKNHAAATRILNPVTLAFSTYKDAETAYNTANYEWEHAKKDKKAEKEPERTTKMVDMEGKRELARQAMTAARTQVAALSAGEFAGGDAEMKLVREYINRTLNNNTIYYTQMKNANILPGNGWEANMRTCNMTVISMMLEALGKTTKDYNGGDLNSVTSIMAGFSKQLGENNSTPDDLSKLRLPDFMQLVAIDLKGSASAAAGSITSHAFIIEVARKFGLHTTEVKKGQVQDRKEDDNGFLGTKYARPLDTIGALYRPAATDARKALATNDEYKALKKDSEKKAFAKQFTEDFSEKRRVEYSERVAGWIEMDTKTKEQLTALQDALNNAPASADPKKPSPFEADLQGKVDEIIGKLGELETAIPKELKGKHTELKNIIAEIQKARAKDGKKPEAGPKNLKVLFDGKGNKDPLTIIEGNLKKYEYVKGVYDKLGEEGGIEELVPVDDYKASVIPTMQTAINNGNQVMVNLENHFVRLQSVAEDGFTIDDPGNTYGENNKITWEEGRKNGYFKHYLMLAP